MFNKKGLVKGLDCLNSAIHILLSLSRDDVDYEELFSYLMTRAMIYTKMSNTSEAFSDLNQALILSKAVKSEFQQRSLRALALLQKGYVFLTIGNDPMKAMLTLNESWVLNPCANLNGEVHSKLIWAIRENEYFDKDDWYALVNRIIDDFGELGVRSCTSFLESSPTHITSVSRATHSEVDRIVQGVNIHWMLYAIYDAVGDQNLAWAHLRYAHDIDRAKLGELPEQNSLKSENHTKEIIRIYSKSFWKNRPVGSQSNIPIFIVGFFRSGSTLLENMLAQHTSVGTVGESTLLIEHITALKEASIKIPHIVKEQEGEILRNQTKLYLKDLRHTHKEINPNKKVTRIVDKMLWNFRNLGIIQSMLPKAHIIHIVRDPLDTLSSCFRNRFMGGAADWSLHESTLAKEYAEYLQIIQHFDKVLPEKRIIHVSYEALVTDTKLTMQFILDAMGLSWDENVMRTSLRKSKVLC